MPRLKVVHAAKFYPPVSGGIETVVADLCRGTAPDWSVAVVAAHTGRTTVRESIDGIDVVRVGAIGVASSVPVCLSLPSHLWRARADCVVLHEPNPIAGTALALRRPAQRLVIWHHSDIVRPWWAPPTYGRLQRLLYARADCVIVSSPNLAEASPIVRAARRVEVIPFGVDLARFRSPDPARVRMLRARTRGPHLLFVGRLVYYKGVDVLIDALSAWPGTLTLVGEGPLEPDLRRRAAERGVLDRVVFAGRVSEEDLVAYYHASDVMVLPSVARSETFGVVQVEAMAAGLPVVSTRLPTGVPWVNEDGISGVVVAPGDPVALGGALRALAGDAPRRAMLGATASRRATALFDRRAMVDAFRHLIEDLVDAEQQCESHAVAGVEAL